MFVSFAVVTHC